MEARSTARSPTLAAVEERPLAEWRAGGPLVRLAVWLAERLPSGRTSWAWSTGYLLADSLAGRLVMDAYWLAVWLVG